jgi:hypothetical protein
MSMANTWKKLTKLKKLVSNQFFFVYEEGDLTSPFFLLAGGAA